MKQIRLPAGGSPHERIDAEMRCSRTATMAPRKVSHTNSQRDSSSETVMPELKP